MFSTDRMRLGKTSIEVTRLGMGASAFGSLYADMTDDACAQTLNRFFEICLNFLDTAPFYGFGKSEERLGALLADRRRSKFVLSTKVGRLLLPEDPANLDRTKFVNPSPNRVIHDYSYDGIMRSVEESLKRLHLDCVDILLIHDPDDHYQDAIDGAYPALEKLRSEGSVKAIGAGMNQSEMLARFAREGDFDCFLLAGRYTLLEQRGLAELLPLCERKGISVIIGGPYNSGILATGVQDDARYEYQSAPLEVVEKVRRLDVLCLQYAVPRKAAALQFPLAHPAVASVIPGCRSAAEVEENAAMIEFPIPPEFWLELKAARILEADAPVPRAAVARRP
jgi:D-threo-aldose 1-dehydrogenase